MLSSMGCRKPASQQAVCLQSGETWGWGGWDGGVGGRLLGKEGGVRRAVAPPDREPFY